MWVCVQTDVNTHTQGKWSVLLEQRLGGSVFLCCALSSFSFTKLWSAYCLLTPNIYPAEENAHLTPVDNHTLRGIFLPLFLSFCKWWLEIKLTFPVCCYRQAVYESVSLCSLLWQHWIITYYYQINMLTQFPISVWSHAEFNLAVKIQGSPAVNVAVVCVCAGALFALDDFTGGLSRQHSCFFLQGGHVRSGRRHKTGAFARRVAASRRWKWGFLAEPAGDLDPRCSSLCGSRSVRLLLPLSKLHWDPQEDLITLLTCFVWMVSQCCVQFSR